MQQVDGVLTGWLRAKHTNRELMTLFYLLVCAIARLKKANPKHGDLHLGILAAKPDGGPYRDW